MVDNAFNMFDNLVNTGGVDVVTIVTLNANSTSSALTLGGAAVTVIGDSVAVGEKAYVRDGVIIRQAPSLVIYEVSV